jgi:hypothetical protein
MFPFTPRAYTYDRRYPPLFFNMMSSAQMSTWLRAVPKINREYFRVAMKCCDNADTVLSNGMTLAEWAMFLCVQKHHHRSSGSG